MQERVIKHSDNLNSLCFVSIILLLDSGASYESANAPTNPREHIRRIRADYPNDPRSPFYDPDGNMKPLARLYVSRQRLYERNCPEETGWR